MIKTYLKQHLNEVKKSIKLIDVEERFDIYFSRFFGLYFAKIGVRFGWTPTFLSFISLLLGVVGGILFLYQDSLVIMLIACTLVVWAGVLDSSDGQLARMTNQSSELGRSIDGTIDNFVFLAIYTAGTIYLLLDLGYAISIYSLDLPGYGIILSAFLAGGIHSYKTAIYDFYKMEYMHLVGKSKGAKVQSLSELMEKAKNADTYLNKILYLVLWNHAKQQYQVSTRSVQTREIFESVAYGEEPKDSAFTSAYAVLNKPMLSWWALFCGTNTHRTLIMLFGLLGRFDLYLIVTVAGAFPVWIISRVQKKRDEMLLAMIEEKELVKT